MIVLFKIPFHFLLHKLIDKSIHKICNFEYIYLLLFNSFMNDKLGQIEYLRQNNG